MLLERHIPIVSERRTSYDNLVLDNGLVHRSIYTDPAIFEAEMTQIFAANWVFLLHESEIAQPNDFKVVTVGRRSTIVTRTESGQLVAFLNRCTHRGSPVCLENAGNRSRFTCPYHGWTFSNDGQLASVTFPDGYGPGFDHAAHRLGRLPRVESYRGFVFGSLNPDVEPLPTWLGQAREAFDWAIDKDAIGPRGVSVIESVKMTYHGNWKQQNDNNTDGYHTPFLHKATNLMNARRHGPGKWLSHVTDRTEMICQYFGNGHKMGDHRAELKSSWRQARPFPGREAFAEELERECGQDASEEYLELVGRAGINLVIYPNLLIMGNGMFAVFEPVAVDLTHVRYFTTLINDAPDSVNKLRIRFDEDFHSLGSRDDSEIMERIQHTLTTIPEMEWLDLSRGICRQTVDPQTGVMTSNKTDDTAIRGSYGYWKTQMGKPVQLKLG